VLSYLGRLKKLITFEKKGNLHSSTNLTINQFDLDPTI
jgi:hypothetical protein